MTFGVMVVTFGVRWSHRLYDPDAGEIWIGGRNIKEYNPVWLRSQIGASRSLTFPTQLRIFDVASHFQRILAALELLPVGFAKLSDFYVEYMASDFHRHVRMKHRTSSHQCTTSDLTEPHLTTALHLAGLSKQDPAIFRSRSLKANLIYGSERTLKRTGPPDEVTACVCQCTVHGRARLKPVSKE
jgi:hypothetical protein